MYSKQFLDDWYADEIKNLIFILRIYKAASNFQKSTFKPYILDVFRKINYIRELQGRASINISKIHVGLLCAYIDDTEIDKY